MTKHELSLFMKKVHVNSITGCWEWTGNIIGTGYGYAYVNWTMRLAHRVSYEHFIGEIYRRNQIDHKCMIKNCVNPAHLQQVSAATNMCLAVERGENFNSNKIHCPQGHLYDEKNTYYRKEGVIGHRKCRTCHRDRERERARRNQQCH